MSSHILSQGNQAVYINQQSSGNRNVKLFHSMPSRHSEEEEYRSTHTQPWH